ncbi:MAG: aminotransferase class I/II-fold pyridoxal phosphate-dependent enzyme [bacterium]|nr:aminotransferase class I/II-fold pyridoxal phosphate-dependent enzyme [bacterium]
MQFSTKAIHVGQEPDPSTGSVIPPIHMTSTYAQEAPDIHRGYDYTRANNPNFVNLELTLAALEQAKYATVFSSGLGALTALVSTLASGDKVLATNDLYGGTYRLFVKVFRKFGIEIEVVDTQDLDAVEAALKSKPKMILIESPSNPLLRISDLEAIGKLARKYGVRSLVDNTFASAYLQNPIALGIDVVLHSTTKYIGGHSDIIGGVVISDDQELKKEMDFARKALGLNPSPFDCWLASRGVKTLALRMEKHCENAKKLAAFLANHKSVKKVYYPGLADHPLHAVAKKQMRHFGGMISVQFDMELEKALKLASSLKLFTLAESLGGVESLVGYPSAMTHASIPEKDRSKIGNLEGIIRFSVGIEDGNDLVEDVKMALE